MRKIINPWLHKEGYNCFGCSPDNPIGLHMEFYEDGDDIISFWNPQQHFQGWVGTMHGGIIATLIDETAGWVVTRKLQTAGMTTQMDVRYKRSILTSDTQIIVRAHIVEQKHNIVFIAASVENGNGDICVESKLSYFAMSKDKAQQMGFSHCDVENEQLLSM